MITTIPFIPADAPIVVRSSETGPSGPADHNIDAASQWWVDAVYRNRLRNARAVVYAPGAVLDGGGMISVSLPADCGNDACGTAEFARDVAVILVRLATEQEAEGDWDSLKSLMSPQGPMGGQSSAAWFKTLEWLKDARGITDARELPSLSI